jgi:hypothetical protein
MNRGVVVVPVGSIMDQGRIILRTVLAFWQERESGKDLVQKIIDLQWCTFYLEDPRIQATANDSTAFGHKEIKGWEFLTDNMDYLKRCYLNEGNSGTIVPLGPGGTKGAANGNGKEIWRVIPSLIMEKKMKSLVTSGGDKERKVFVVEVKSWDLDTSLVMDNMLHIWSKMSKGKTMWKLKLEVDSVHEENFDTESFFQYLDYKVRVEEYSIQMKNVNHSIKPFKAWMLNPQWNQHGGIRELGTTFWRASEENEEDEKERKEAEETVQFCTSMCSGKGVSYSNIYVEEEDV